MEPSESGGAAAVKGKFLKKIRLKWIILPEFQYRLIFWNLLTSTVVFILVLLQVARAMSELRTLGQSAGFPEGHPYYQFIGGVSANLYFFIAGSFIFGMLLSLGVTIFISHRLSGPIYRLIKYFQSLADGAPASDIKFRKNDFMEQYAPVINEAVRKLRSPS